MSTGPSDFTRAMGPIAIEILGQPNASLSTREELRWNGRGSLAVDLNKGTWFDHECGEGGGVLDFLRVKRGMTRDDALQHLVERGHLTPDAKGPSTASPRLIQTYDYVDSTGTLIFQVCRFEPKDFRQRRPDGKGGWVWKMTGVQKVLYRLPTVAEAVAARQTIFVCEGEKAVDAMVSRGLVATCSPGGALKWKDSAYTAALLGADVVVLPDADEPGDAHANQVFKALKGKAWRVRIQALPGLPAKGDAFDYFASGRTAEELQRFIADTAPRGWGDIPHPHDTGQAAPAPTEEINSPDFGSRSAGADTVISARGNFHQLRESLDKDFNSAVRATHANLMLILKGDQLLQNLVKRDAFTGRVIITRAAPVISAAVAPAPGPYPRQLDDGDITRVQAYLQKEWAHNFKRATVDECLLTEAQDGQFHPVKDWLARLRWDGKKRIEQWLTKTFGCELDAYHRAVGSKLLIAAVRRVRQPGCKFDYMVVFGGKQGIGKSRALLVLFGQDWCTDDLPDDLANKDAAISLSGAWCVELAEISQLMRSEAETVKAFLSRAVDRYRPPYGRSVIEVPRQCVLVGTTNSNEYLRDPTGNRRIWPVQCRSVGAADIQWLADNREQLWAEAAHQEATGTSIWLDDLGVQQTAVEAQGALMADDPWADRVRRYIQDRASVTIPEILEEALLIALSVQDRRAQMRVATILQVAGWTKKQVWNAEMQTSVKQWTPPARQEAEGG